MIKDGIENSIQFNWSIFMKYNYDEKAPHPKGRKGIIEDLDKYFEKIEREKAYRIARAKVYLENKDNADYKQTDFIEEEQNDQEDYYPCTLNFQIIESRLSYGYEFMCNQ